jgi:CheY-like chemotaxis protein
MSLDEGIKRARILVVDDEEANVLLLQEVVKHAGYNNFPYTWTTSRT